MTNISEEAASAYVNRHLAFIGVPEPAIVQADRALSLAELEGGELQAEPPLPPAAAAAVMDDLFAQISNDAPDAGSVSNSPGERVNGSRKRRSLKTPTAVSATSPKRRKSNSAAAAATDSQGAQP
jgi:hypothetical protein